MAAYRDVEFSSADGTILRGRFYPARTDAPCGPAVVMAHGFGGVVELRLEQFAEAFCEAGLAVLVYDHRNFGTSDGPIRQEVEPWQQVNDWREAITFAATLPGVDPERLGVWGSSLAGGHVLVLGATDARVRCVVSQVPFISGAGQTLRNLTPAMAPENARLLAADRSARMRGEPPGRLAIASEGPETPAALATPEAYAWTLRWGRLAPTFRNEVTLRSLEYVGAYEPGSYIAHVSPTPLLMLVGSQDNVAAAGLALDAYSRAHEPKALVLLDGGHFSPYDEEFARASDAAIAWFRRHLA